ncbi:protein DCL homolog, chloroplastic [Mercurialis annua]|uniref:protein DCL homolog, chloroplastic n=1 Tax=Mercurialis annua TaxID=3986 RepID=UPI0021607917|nr:protein DCL homolog, chloroplastic [Mercurialis annua]
MAAPLLRSVPQLRFRLHGIRNAARILFPFRRPWNSMADSIRTEDEVSSSTNKKTIAAALREPPKYPGWDDPDYRKWKDKEKEIMHDIESITCLTKEILHSDKYLDGERLTAEDEEAVVEKLLMHHPNSEDKIGCGLDSIMVDRHPQFRQSRCLFVVRTDGGWIDFSYQKCLRAYIRNKYPPHADRFIREHFKRGS